MASEIFLSAPPGLSPLVQLYNGVAPVGSPLPLTALASLSDYIGDMPAVPYGRYSAIAYVAGTPDVKLASGQILWDGKYEFPIGQSMLLGLDPNNPSHIKPTHQNTGNIDIDISGDGITETILTRV